MPERTTEEMLRRRLERDARTERANGIAGAIVLAFLVLVVLAVLYWH